MPRVTPLNTSSPSSVGSGRLNSPAHAPNVQPTHAKTLDRIGALSQLTRRMSQPMNEESQSNRHRSELPTTYRSGGGKSWMSQMKWATNKTTSALTSGFKHAGHTLHKFGQSLNAPNYQSRSSYLDNMTAAERDHYEYYNELPAESSHTRPSRPYSETPSAPPPSPVRHEAPMIERDMTEQEARAEQEAADYYNYVPNFKVTVPDPNYNPRPSLSSQGSLPSFSSQSSLSSQSSMSSMSSLSSQSSQSLPAAPWEDAKPTMVMVERDMTYEEMQAEDERAAYNNEYPNYHKIQEYVMQEPARTEYAQSAAPARPTEAPRPTQYSAPMYAAAPPPPARPPTTRETMRANMSKFLSEVPKMRNIDHAPASSFNYLMQVMTKGTKHEAAANERIRNDPGFGETMKQNWLNLRHHIADQRAQGADIPSVQWLMENRPARLMAFLANGEGGAKLVRPAN
jgi:hypothetical protein